MSPLVDDNRHQHQLQSNKYQKQLPPPPVQWPHHLSKPHDLGKLLKKFRHSSRSMVNELQIVKSPIVSRLVLQIVGSWAYLVANVFNKSRVFNVETFNKELELTEIQLGVNNSNNSDQDSEKQQPIKASPLLTLSNHISCIDDPVLWGSLLPSVTYYSLKTNSVRWSPAATEVCFSKPWHSSLFSLGKTFPISRGAGLHQPAMDFSLALLNCNQWIHFFPEGRVMRDNNGRPLDNEHDFGYKFRWGISKLIMDYFSPQKPKHYHHNCSYDKDEKTLRVLPFYHLGLDAVMPLGWPYLPRFGKLITIYIRPTAIELNNLLLTRIFERQSMRLDDRLAKGKSVDDIKRIKLTNYLEDEMDKLKEQALRLHLSTNMKQHTAQKVQ